MKVICTGYNRTERYFIKGKTYNVENGKITNENGYTYEDVTNEKVLKYLSEWYKFEEVKNDCIVIYRKDNETIALDKTTGKKAVAKCSPEDTYDFYTGAKLAFERLTGTEKKEPEFKPYLTCSNFHYGFIGDKTPIRDVLNRELRIGDTVEVYDECGDFIGEFAVVCNEQKSFIMSIEMHCKKDGTITDNYKVIKKRHFAEIANGESVGFIRYVKERGTTCLIK